MHRILTRGDKVHVHVIVKSLRAINGGICSSLYMNFRFLNLDFEPEDKIKMGSCLRGVYGVFNDLSDDVSIVGSHHVDQKL